jgi:hypothetical protein
MANTKNFGLDGVASSLQLGKAGQQIVSADGKISAKSADGTALVNLQAADPVEPSDVVTKQVLDAVDGATIKLGTPSDASLSDGAVPLTSSTTVVNAVDQLNEILGKLVPVAPTNFPAGQTLTLVGGSTGLLAAGAIPNNTAGGTLPVTAGSVVTRIITATATSNTIGDNGTTGFVGPGDSGTVQALVNGVVADSQVMDTGSQNKSGVLTITNDQAFPLATPGFWESFRAQVVGAAAGQGWNRFKLNHTTAGATNDVYFVRDNLTANPVVSAGTVTEGTAGTYSYSSGIPHYGSGGILNVSFNATNLSGETYKSGTILSLASTTANAFSTINYTTGQAGLPAILDRQTTSFGTAALALAIDGTNMHNATQISASAYNLNGSGSTTFGPMVLIKRGTSTRIDELSFPVSIAVNGGVTGNGFRVSMTDGATPADDKSGLTGTDWVSANSLNAWDAAVVGGVLKHDVTDYSTGYLPVGPDRSSQSTGGQYITIALRRTAVSKFDIAITGTYTSISVKLPGVTESNTTTANGWYSMSTLYGGAGFPGDTNGANSSLGCALGAVASGSGSFTCTFGTLSSTSSSNNLILVRIRLAAGQSISALSFVPATR